MSWRCHGQNYAELVSNLQKHGILSSPEAAAAMSKIDRKLFVPEDGLPYNDAPQIIGFGATISAPHMHGYCLSLLADHLKPGMSVLDVGSGSGYLTAVFGLMVGETGQTVGVEHIPELVDRSILAIKQTPASYLLDKDHLNIYGNPMQIGALMGFAIGNTIHCDVIQLFAFFFVLKTLSDVQSKQTLLRKQLKKVKETNMADGKLGYADGAPYDAIHVGAAASVLPDALVDQLKLNGRMVIPVGTSSQDLVIVDKLADGSIRKTVEMGVRYVPLV